MEHLTVRQALSLSTAARSLSAAGQALRRLRQRSSAAAAQPSAASGTLPQGRPLWQLNTHSLLLPHRGCSTAELQGAERLQPTTALLDMLRQAPPAREEEEEEEEELCALLAGAAAAAASSAAPAALWPEPQRLLL